MQQIKKMLSLLLVLAMMFSLSISAFATEETTSDNSSKIQFDADSHNDQINRKNSAALMSGDAAQRISNDYLEYYVADTSADENSGRFTVGNKEGNPNYTSDNNKILLYGHGSPWSSYTSIVIDGNVHVFKADDTNYDATKKVVTSTMTVEDVLITQTLKFVKNENTDLKDTVQISYKAENKSGTAKKIAIRIMLDTMLGNNDGAPFKVPSVGNVTKETELRGNAIPQYWQAFDNLEKPDVFAVGSLYREGDRKPDKVQFTSWNNVYVADHAWDYTIDPDTRVTGDSAVSVYWNEKKVNANSSLKVSTYYGVGYAGGADATAIDVPQNGFALMVVDEDNKPVSDVKVSQNGTLSTPRITDENGLAIFNDIHYVDANTKTVGLSLEKSGYQSVTVQRQVDRGGLTGATIFEADGKAHVLSANGTIDGSTTDLLVSTKYFKENAGGTSQASDKSNVKELKIKVEASSEAVVNKYQLIQDGSVVVESNTSTITIPVLTGTPENKKAFGSDWRIEKLKAGKKVYLRVVDAQGNKSAKKLLGIKVSKPKAYSSGGGSETIKFGSSLTFSVPSDVPILGDTELDFGWEGLPFEFDIDPSGTVKFAINPKVSHGSGSVDGTRMLNWEEVEKDYNDAFAAVAEGRSSAAKAFGGKPQGFGAGKFSVEASITGYGEGHVDNNGNIRVNVGLIVSVSENGQYTWTAFVGYVPVYVTVSEKVSLTGKGEVSVLRSNDRWSVSGAVGEINPKFKLGVDGGVGVADVLSLSAGGSGTLSWLYSMTNNHHLIDLTGEAHLTATAFLFKAQKEFARGTWTLYDSYGASYSSANTNASFGLYDENSYSLIRRNNNGSAALMSDASDIVKMDVFADAQPKMVKVGSKTYLFWIDHVESRTDSNSTALVYSVSEDCETWSEPVQIIPESENSTADYDFAIAVADDIIQIAICKAKKQFADEVTLDEMAAASEIYHATLNTSNNKVNSGKFITDDDTADYMPTVAVKGNKTYIGFAENKLEDGYFGTGSTHAVSSAVVSGSRVTVKSSELTGKVAAVAVGLLGSDMSVAYVEDTDGDYSTETDRELFVFDGQDTNKITENEVCESSPAFIKADGSNQLIWQEDGNIGSLSRVNGEVSYLFEDNTDMNLGRNFYVLNDKNGNASSLVWTAEVVNDDGSTNHFVYESSLERGKWSKPFITYDMDSEMSSAISGYSSEGQDYIAFIRTTEVSEQGATTVLCASPVEPYNDVELYRIGYINEDMKPGQNLPLTFGIRNNGNTTVDSIEIRADGQTVGAINHANLGKGEEKELTFEDYVVPSNLTEAREICFSIAVQDEEKTDNNQLTTKLGYTNLAVNASSMILNDCEWASITVFNRNNIPTDATLRIIADEKDGAVLLEKKLENVTAGENQSLMVNLDELAGDVNVRAFYITITSDKEEVALSDNEQLIFLGLAESENEYTLGDVNGDGEVNANDVTALARHIAKIESIADEALLAAADVNKDGDVGAEDLTHLARFIAKIIPEL